MTTTSTSPDATSPPASSAGASARDLTELLDILTHQAQSGLGSTGQSVFFFGDGVQRALTDGFFDLFKLRTWSPNNILRLSLGAVRQTVHLSQMLLPQQAYLAWQELRNKLEVFTTVKNLSSELKLPPGKFIPLPELVEKAYSVPPFLALWVVEGVGHDYADRYWEHYGAPQGLLSEEQAPVPAKSLLMLHAGMGLSFADRLLGELTSQASCNQVRSAVESFVTLCRANARRGYLGAAVESLGLQTRVFYPDLLRRVEQQVRVVAPEFLGFFWHGAGRALYFSREYFVPALRTVWLGVDEEASATPDRLSAMAGLSWAVTLVNMRQTAIMHNVVCNLPEPSLVEGFTNGVVSSIIMREDTTPGEAFTPAFFQQEPESAAEVATWNRLIFDQVQAGLHRYYPILREHRALDEVFRYQDLSGLVSRLQGDSRQKSSRMETTRSPFAQSDQT